MFGGLCVKGSGAFDHIIPAFPVPLNLITSLNQPIITKCQRFVRACVCRMCVWNFRVAAAVNIWAPTWDELNKLFNLSTDAHTRGTPLTTLISRRTAEWKWNGGNCLDYGCFVIQYIHFLCIFSTTCSLVFIITLLDCWPGLIMYGRLFLCMYWERRKTGVIFLVCVDKADSDSDSWSH